MTNTNTSLLTDLPDWTLIAVNGPDAGNFLQNLLTNHVLNLQIGDQHLSGFCTAKGRLIASCWVSHPAKDHYHLWVSADLVVDFAKRLSMYRLRSKVEINPIENAFKITGELSQGPLLPTSSNFCNLPAVLYEDTLYQRRLLLTPISELNPTSNHILWSILEVQSGIPRITHKTQDLFVPQMINFESLGGIDFKKGCYPGQEIVARSQYLGTIKRRLKIALMPKDTASAYEIQPGTELFSESDPDQACGVVVLASLDQTGQRYCFQIELKLSEIDAPLFFKLPNSQNSAVLSVIDPPYPLITI
jgi:folate-binding protein YgfZ